VRNIDCIGFEHSLLKLQAVPRDPIPYLYIRWSPGLLNYELYIQFNQPAVTTVKNVKLISMSCDHVLKYGPETLC